MKTFPRVPNLSFASEAPSSFPSLKVTIIFYQEPLTGWSSVQLRCQFLGPFSNFKNCSSPLFPIFRVHIGAHRMGVFPKSIQVNHWERGGQLHHGTCHHIPGVLARGRRRLCGLAFEIWKLGDTENLLEVVWSSFTDCHIADQSNSVAVLGKMTPC